MRVFDGETAMSERHMRDSEVATEGAARINDRGNLKVGRAESQKTSRR